MPQTKVEKKFCSLSVGSRRQNIASLIDKKLGVAEFQSLNQILFVKLDTRTVSSKDAVRRGGSDA